MASLPHTSTISFASERDICFWCAKLRVSRAMLKQLVTVVGNRASDIERHLKYWDS